MMKTVLRSDNLKFLLEENIKSKLFYCYSVIRPIDSTARFIVAFLHKCVSSKRQGLFAWREEDPSTRKILESETIFLLVYKQKFRLQLLFIIFVPGARIFRVNAVYMVLTSSQCSQLGRSQRQGQVRVFACKPNPENIWRQDDPPPRIFLVLGCSSLHVNSPLKGFAKNINQKD